MEWNDIPPLANYGRRTQVIGSGVVGTVYLTESNHVIKAVGGDPPTYQTIREIAALKRIRSDYVIRLLDVDLQPDISYLVLPFVPQTLTHRYGDPDLDIHRVFRQMCLGVADIHNANLLHLDLKPDNILVDEDGHAYIADLGICEVSTCAVPQLRVVAVSLWYRSPEVHLSKSISPKADVWSLGVMLAEMMLSDRMTREVILLPGNDDDEHLDLIRRLVGGRLGEGNLRRRLAGFPDAAVRLIERMLDPDPVTRPSIFEVLMDPWFNTPYQTSAEYRQEIPCREVLRMYQPTVGNMHVDPVQRLVAIDEILRLCHDFGNPVLAGAVHLVVTLGDFSPRLVAACVYIAACIYDPQAGTGYQFIHTIGEDVREVLVRINFDVIASTSYLFLAAQSPDRILDPNVEAIWKASLLIRSSVLPEEMADIIMRVGTKAQPTNRFDVKLYDLIRFTKTTGLPRWAAHAIDRAGAILDSEASIYQVNNPTIPKPPDMSWYEYTYLLDSAPIVVESTAFMDSIPFRFITQRDDAFLKFRYPNQIPFLVRSDRHLTQLPMDDLDPTSVVVMVTPSPPDDPICDQFSLDTLIQVIESSGIIIDAEIRDQTSKPILCGLVDLLVIIGIIAV